VLGNTLCLQVFDHDRFSKDDIIGEIVMPMLPSDLVNGQTLWKGLQPSEGRTVRCILFKHKPAVAERLRDASYHR